MKEKIISRYRDNDPLRNSFNDLSKKVFNTDFESWYQKKLWGDIYQPFSIVHEGKIIANASAHKIKLIVNGEIKTAVQLGTVMTDESFRGQGLSRQIMEYILDKYEDDTDIFYLFANDTVLDFYPRFGFKRRDHFSLSTKDRIPSDNTYSFRQLDMNDDSDISTLHRIAKNRITNSTEFDVIDAHEIVGFYALNVFFDRMYYDKQNDIIAAYEKKNGILRIIDIILTEPADIVSILGSITDNSVTETRFEFPFDTDKINLIKTRIDDDDNAFFIKGNLNENINIVYPRMAQG